MSSKDRTVPSGEPSSQILACRRALLPDPNALGAGLFEAVERGDFDRVRELLAHGEDINAPDRGTAFFDGETVLIKAASRGDAEVVQLLLANGAEVDARSASGWTALMRACNAGKFDCARLLLDAGADPGIRNDDGYTAYGRIPGNDTNLIQLVRDRGADVL
jgi:ankyrin repeat protein